MKKSLRYDDAVGAFVLCGEDYSKKYRAGCRDTACRVRCFVSRVIPLETFHRNVSKITVQQAGHRAERSCSLRPRKAVAFLTHLPRAPEAWRREFRCLRTATQEAPRLLRTSRQLRSAGAAFSGKPFWNLLVSARCFLYNTACRISIPRKFLRSDKKRRSGSKLLRRFQWI